MRIEMLAKWTNQTQGSVPRLCRGVILPPFGHSLRIPWKRTALRFDLHGTEWHSLEIITTLMLDILGYRHSIQHNDTMDGETMSF